MIFDANVIQIFVSCYGFRLSFPISLHCLHLVML